jgi:hypothetical protein
MLCNYPYTTNTLAAEMGEHGLSQKCGIQFSFLIVSNRFVMTCTSDPFQNIVGNQ